jgi:hypothetical protein
MFIDKKKINTRVMLVFKKLKKEIEKKWGDNKSKMEINDTIRRLKDGHKVLIGTFKD